MVEYWIWLSQIKGLGPATQKRLIKDFGDPASIFIADKQDLNNLYGMKQYLVERILSSRSLEKSHLIMEKARKAEIKIITYNDPLIPTPVEKYQNTPILLYYRGKVKDNSMGIGIIGARRCTEYGKQVTKDAATYLAEKSITIISGMAKGIDGYAHTACIKAGGYTLAFLGSGVDICYPAEHRDLMNKIIETGAVVSPFPPGTQAYPHNFLIRNELMSVWCLKLLVVEACENSGTLTTSTYAREQKKMVFAVPNSIFLKESVGTNRLISEGAHIYLEPSQLLLEQENEIMNLKVRKEDINKSLEKIEKANMDKKLEPSSALEEKILQIIMSGVKKTDELLQCTSEDKTTIFETLCILELKQKIKISFSGTIEL